MTKIDNLIDALVSDLVPVRRHALRARLGAALAIGLVGAVMALLISLGLRPHLHQVTIAAFWVKFSYTAVMMVAAVVALEQVARPDGSIGGMLRVSAMAVGAVALLAIGQLAMSPTSSYSGLVLGYSALFCPFLILAFGLPAFFANMWFLRRAAPMDTGIAGFVAGACAGATGAWVYSWACVENGIPFIGIWYTLGILFSGILGRYVGKFTLRW